VPFFELQHLHAEENLLSILEIIGSLKVRSFGCKSVACLDSAHACSDARKATSIWSSQWLYEHVQAAAHGWSEAEAAAIKFVRTIVQGDLPQLPALLEASPIPAEKAGGSIRPIAVGEVWDRLA
jgi:hypothetical protein